MSESSGAEEPPMMEPPSSNSSSSSPTKHHMRMYRQSVKMFEPDKMKNSNRRLRWNQLWTILTMGVGLMPIWINYAAGCTTGWAIVSVVLVLLDATYWVAAILVWFGLYAEWKEYKNTSPELRHIPTPKLDKNKSFKQSDEVVTALTTDEPGCLPSLAHLVIMCGYDEPIELICATLDTVAAQTRAKSIVMVIGLEERTPDFQEKVEFFDNRYGDCFFKLIQTIHPFGLQGEIPGTCSNANWAVRQSTALMRDQGMPFDPERTLLTKLDTDTLFLPNHFEVLERQFLALSPDSRINVMFQSVLTYNVALDQRWFFTRVTGILRTFFTIGFLIPLNINTMSIYSLSLALARKAHYWLPHYQMEDIIQNLNLMVGTKKRVPIKLIPLPTLSGPTSGNSFCDELSQWFLQVRRWSIGAAEVFHYYIVKLIGGKFELCSGASYGCVFTCYYVFVLCVASLFPLFASFGMNLNGCKDVIDDYNGRADGTAPFPYVSHGTLLVGLLVIKYIFVFCTAWAADAIHRKILGVEEPSLGVSGGLWGMLRSVAHYLSVIVVLLAYSFSKAASFIELSIRGRKICGHEVSCKSELRESVATMKITCHSSRVCSSRQLRRSTLVAEAALLSEVEE